MGGVVEQQRNERELKGAGRRGEGKKRNGAGEEGKERGKAKWRRTVKERN